MWKEVPASLKEGKNSVELVLFCPQDMVWDLKYKTVRWSFVESLEPPYVVQVRCSSMLNPSNVYGQVTVRMHTRQVGVPAFLHSQVGQLPMESWLWLPRTLGPKEKFAVVILPLTLHPSHG